MVNNAYDYGAREGDISRPAPQCRERTFGTSARELCEAAGMWSRTASGIGAFHFSEF
jgi:hypothetical protein